MKPKSGVNPGRVPPSKMTDREWARFISDNGLQGASEELAFPPDWTGFSVDPAGDINYIDFGAIVWMYRSAVLVGTSNAATCAFTGIPAQIRPSGTRLCECYVVNSSGTNIGAVEISAAGAATFFVGTVTPVGVIETIMPIAGNFVASGNKGLPAGWLIKYPK